MKKRFLLLMLTLVCAVCLVLGVSGCGLFGGSGDDDADQDEIGEYYTDDQDLGYQLSEDGNSYSVVFSNNTVSDIVIPDTINGLPVTEIADDVFSNDGLESVTIGKNITIIGNNAFRDNGRLKSLTLNSKVTTIGSYAFYGCTWLTSIIIPDSVTTIGSAAFAECKSLTSVNLPSGITKIEDYTFSGCFLLESIIIPDGVIFIGECAFDECTSLESITLPEGLTTIREFAFEVCVSLESITIPDSVTSLSTQAFEGCTIRNVTGTAYAISLIESSNFESVTITGGEISAYIFRGRSLLTSVTLNEGVTGIQDQAFYGCNLESIVIPSSVTFIGESAFEECSKVTSVVFEENSKCESIGDYAFANCPMLAQITNMPEATFNENIITGSTLITVSDLAVTYDNGKYLGGALIGIVDSSAEYFIVKDGTTSIDANVFSECTALRFVYIPESVTKIGSGALKFASVSTNCTTVIFFEASSGRNSTSTTYANWLGTYSSGDRLASQYYTCVGSAKLADEYIYTVSSDEAEIYAYYGTDTAITVPSTIDGYTVSGVNGYAYAELDITSVTFPSTCDTLGGDVPNMTSTAFMPFGWCDELTTVTFSAMSVDIEAYSFYNCTALTNVNFGSAQMATIMNNAFDGCTSLTSIALPTMLRLGQSIFSGCTALASVTAGSDTSVTITGYMDTSGNSSYNASISINNGEALATALKQTYATTYIIFYINIDMSAYLPTGE